MRTALRMVGTMWALGEGVGSSRDHINIEDKDDRSSEDGAKDGRNDVDVGEGCGELQRPHQCRGRQRGRWERQGTALRMVGTTWMLRETGVGSSTAAVPW